MLSSSFLYLTGVALVVYPVLWIIYAKTLHPLSKIPGPFLPSITRLWMTYRVMRGDMDVVQRSLHQRYGPLVRIAPDEVACADPEAIRKIYPTQAPLTKTDFYHIWDNKTLSKYPDNFSETNEKRHRERRRIVNNVYSMSTVLTFEPYLDRCEELFIERMGQIADTTGSIDLGEWLQWYAFDVIGELFFGRMFGFMQNSHDHESYIKSMDALLPVLTVAAVSSPVTRFVILGSSMINSATRRALQAVDHIVAAARECVKKRKDNNSEDKGPVQGSRTDFLHHLLHIVSEKGEKVDFGMGEVENEAYVALFAGSDTTAIALRAVFYYLLKNKQAYHDLQQEIDNATIDGRLSSPPRYAEASNLPLLCASIKEAMRLHPSVGLTIPRIVGPEGLVIADTFIPAGWKVGMNAAVVGYDRRVHGTDAYDFRPARWLEGDSAQMDRYSLVFGAGTRTCIGKNISLSEIHKLVPFVLQKFDLSLVDPSKDWITEDFWFNKQRGLDVRISRR